MAVPEALLQSLAPASIQELPFKGLGRYFLRFAAEVRTLFARRLMVPVESTSLLNNLIAGTDTALCAKRGSQATLS